MKLRIYYEDTDISGVVYHARYFNFCERARSELFFKNNQVPYTKECHFVIKDLKADFIKFATLGDVLDVDTRVKSIKNASVELLHDIRRNNETIFKMALTVVFLSKDGKISKITQEMKDLLKTIM